MNKDLPWGPLEWRSHCRNRKIERANIKAMKKNKLPVFEPLGLALKSRELAAGLRVVFRCIKEYPEIKLLYEASGGLKMSPDQTLQWFLTTERMPELKRFKWARDHFAVLTDMKVEEAVNTVLDPQKKFQEICQRNKFFKAVTPKDEVLPDKITLSEFLIPEEAEDEVLDEPLVTEERIFVLEDSIKTDPTFFTEQLFPEVTLEVIKKEPTEEPTEELVF